MGDLVEFYVNMSTDYIYCDQLSKIQLLPQLNDVSVVIPDDKSNLIHVSVYLICHDDVDFERSNYQFAQETLIFDKTKGTEFIHPIIHYFPEANLYDNPKCPRYMKVVDSSIWNKAIFYGPNVEADFKRVIKEIAWAYSAGLYNLCVSYEYADFNARILKESTLSEINAIAAHGNFVSPFLFHSENDMRENVAKKIAKLNAEDLKSVVENVKWRVLLVDDHASKGLTPANSSMTGNQVRKIDIIINDIMLATKEHNQNIKIVWSAPTEFNCDDILEKATWNSTTGGVDTEVKNDCEDFNIAIVCAKSNDHAEKLLKYAKFDFILLDYLLDTPDTPDTPKQREYSYTLLKKISDSYEANEVPRLVDAGPVDKFYFMYISAFGTAVAERLREQGLIRDTSYWHIARGACPTNTPRLFMYYLYALMEKRYSDVRLEINGLTMAGGRQHTLLDFLKMLFSKGDGNVKKIAADNFSTLLHLRSQYVKMEADYENEDKKVGSERVRIHTLGYKGSLFVRSLFPDIPFYSPAFWEHMQHLIYLTAFATARQWPEMWEEYLFVKDRLIAAEKKLFNVPENKVLTDEEREKRPSYLIEKYIINLKNA